MQKSSIKKAEKNIAREKKIEEEAEIIHKCVQNLGLFKKLDPVVEMTPASVSKF